MQWSCLMAGMYMAGAAQERPRVGASAFVDIAATAAASGYAVVLFEWLYVYGRGST